MSTFTAMRINGHRRYRVVRAARGMVVLEGPRGASATAGQNVRGPRFRELIESVEDLGRDERLYSAVPRRRARAAICRNGDHPSLDLSGSRPSCVRCGAVLAVAS